MAGIIINFIVKHHSDHLGQFYESSLDVCRRTTSGSNNNNRRNNLKNNVTTPNNLLYLIKQYEVDKMYSLRCKRENHVLL